MRKIKRKTIAIILSVVMVISFITPMIVQAVGSSSLDLIGTNEALGSPLLDPNFQVEDWDKWELVAFGVFLSNFVPPFVDDYESAFTSSSERGSKGSGIKALQFGSGNDPANNQVLKSLLNYAISVQKDTRFLKPVQVRYKTRRIDEVEHSSDYRQAKVKELFLWTYSDGFTTMFQSDAKDLLAAHGGSETGDTLTALWTNFLNNVSSLWFGSKDLNEIVKELQTGYIKVDTAIKYKKDTISSSEQEIVGPSEALLPEFSVELSGSDHKVVLDYDNGWDIQMMTAWLAKTFGGKYKDLITEDMFKSFLDCNLYVDAFGNIVAVNNGRPYMMFPAAANQHITATPQYNMLQSVLFGGDYLESSVNTLLEQGKIDSKSLLASARGYSAIGGGDLPKGKTVILYDSDSLLYSRTIKSSSKTKTGNYYTVERSDVPYGKIISDIFDVDISKNQSATGIGFRVETIKAEDISDYSRVKSMGRACNILSIVNPIDPKVPVLNYVKARGMTLNLFGDPVILSVKESNMALSKYPEYVRNVVSNNQVNAGDYFDTWQNIKAKLITEPTVGGATNLLLTGTASSRTGSINTLFKNFILSQVGYSIKRDKDYVNIDDAAISNLKDRGYELIKGGKIDSGTVENMLSRLVKVYNCSSVMQQVSNILAVREGTDFALWSPYIYMTYLDWYGIIGTGTHKFDTKLYDENSGVMTFDIEEATKGMFLSEEEKKKDILDYTYMMLHPTAGKEYRSQIMMDSFSNWVYKTYQNIVYGGSLNYYQSDTVSNRYGNGFLKIDSYSDNFMTGWFIGKYAEYVVIIIAILSVLIIIVGVMAHKKAIWFFVSFILVINIVILTPAIGEIVPFVANNTVQYLFDDKMSYWAISEGVTNATLEKKISNEYKYVENTVETLNIKAEEAKQVLDLVKTLNIAYLDRALMMKLDISRKVTETQLYSYDEIQELQSARWLLPIMLRQFTANDGSANYVYVPLADQFDNLSNMYWKYKPSDMIATQTINAVTGTGTATDVNKTVTDRKNMYTGYSDITLNRSTLKDSIVIGDKYKNNIDIASWQSLSRNTLNDSNATHTFFYMMQLPLNKSIPDNPSGINWKQYVEDNALSLQTSLLSKSTDIETYAGKYSFREIDSVREDFGFLWNTENPLHYFYQVTKDTFDSGKTLSVLAGELQGKYEKSELLGSDVRSSFMHYEDTGKIRDFLDMEELFTNTMPYMYSVQVLTGGFDGKSGALGDKKIELYKIYKNNYKSWLFRSNWVTKLLESPEYTKPEIVSNPDGRKITISNPMIPSSYPADRPMIFSEAQMYALGYNESNLTQVELKIQKVNREVERKWTLMLNYVNIPGMTKEVLYRQMAVEALIQFNKEFTSSSVVNSNLAMYPTGLDLRNISFDSVMKMLMLNSTKDTRFIYGDTMRRVIENNDMFSAVLMLIGAFLCAYVIPFVRNVLLGLLFYLGFFSVFSNILSGGKTKLKITTAFAINNVIFLVMNMLYYLMFSLMIKITYKDNVLSISNITVDVGNPVWIFIIIVLGSGLFLFGSWKLIKFSIINYRDLGFEVFATWAGLLADRISDGAKNASESVSNALKGESGGGSSTGDSVGGSRRGNKTPGNDHADYVRSQQDKAGYVGTIVNTEDWGDKPENSTGDSGYVVDSVNDNTDTSYSEMINNEIEKGKSMRTEEDDNGE